MNKKTMKKVLAGILAMSMVLGMVGVGNLSGKVQTVKAETGETDGVQTRTVNLQTDGDIAGITDPTVPTDTTSAWSGSKVYFGKYAGNPVLFRVLDAKTTDYSADGTTRTMLLDSDTVLKTMAFKSDKASNKWIDSDVKKWMNGDFLSGFSEIEQATIATSTKSSASQADGSGLSGVNWSSLNAEVVFALDVKETMNISYGYSNVTDTASNKIKHNTSNTAAYWWLRSDATTAEFASYVSNAGKSNNADISLNWIGVAPALNLDLSKVLFASMSGTAKSASFAPTETNNNTTWNLTLAGGTGFTATLSDNTLTLNDAVSVNVTSLGATEDYYSQLSAMLVDENGTVLAYGKIGDAVTGNVSFELPSGIETGKYTLKVFAEKVNSSASSNATDYASNMASFMLNVVEAKNINLQVNDKIFGITDPVVPTDTTDAWSGSKVYFGKYANEPVLFRVLDAQTTDYSVDETTQTMLLDSDALFPVMSFDTDKTDNRWYYSDVKTWVQGTGEGTFLRQFSVIEQDTIVESEKNEPSSTDGTVLTRGTFTCLEKEKVFVLDVTEVRNTSYGYSNSEGEVSNRIKQTIDDIVMWWWTRSPYKIDSGELAGDYVNFINIAGKIGNAPITAGYTMGVSPAMNLNLSSILYASASGVDQTSDLAEVGTDLVSNNIWKLTLLDSSKTVGIQKDKCVFKVGTTVTVPYTYAGSDISQLSIMITSTECTDAAAEVLYYGALATVSNSEGSGSATFELPSDLPEGYRVYLLAEDVNDGNFTNYASEPVELGIVISEDHTTDFATFRDGETMEAPVAPSGYVFAGWFYDEACANSPVSSATKVVEDGKKVYAKFVPEKVLSVSAQARYTTDGETNKIDLRLVTTVDSFGYREVGFIVTNRAEVQKRYPQQYVFESLLAAGYKRTPSEINPCSIRFGTINIIGITVSGEGIDPNREIPVQAYWITKDGTEVYGLARTVKLSEAVTILESMN